jgi:arylsulfatase
MGLYGYDRDTTPAIDAFFEDATVFEQAYATTSRTPPSVVSFLSGLLPQHHGVRFFNAPVPPELGTLPKWLGEAGYECAAVVSNEVLTADWTGLNKHFHHYDDEMTLKDSKHDHFERRADATTDAAIEWLESRKDTTRPFFLWVHYIDPHGPYTPPEPKVKNFTHSGPVTFDAENVPKYQRFPDVVDAREYVDLYDEEIAYTDQQAGRLLDALENVMATEETLVAFTADHGESLMDHELWFRHDYHVYEELVRVPLMLRGGPFAGERIAARVSNMDIVPTALELTELNVPESLDAVSLLRPEPSRQIFVESGAGLTMWTCVIADSGKWLNVRDMETGEHSAFLHYNLAEDAQESQPVLWDPKETGAAAPTALLKLYKSKPLVQSDHTLTRELAPEIPPEKESQLRALGYLE